MLRYIREALKSESEESDNGIAAAGISTHICCAPGRWLWVGQIYEEA